MHFETLYLTLCILSLIVSLGVIFYSWSHRKAKGAIAFLWYIGGQTLWLGGFIVELISRTLAGKIFWNSFEWLASLIATIAFPVFAAQYTELKIRNPQKTFLLTLILPILFLLALLTDGIHHQIYSDPYLIPITSFSRLLYDPAPLVYGFILYSYLIIIWGLGLLTRRLFQSHDLYRAQIAILILGFMTPNIGSALTLLNIRFFGGWNILPIAIAIANFILSIGFFRFHLFQVVPIGRDRLFEAMVDPVVILDDRHKIIDINTAMLTLLNKNGQEVIGRAAKQIFANFPIPIKRYTHVSYAREETTFEIGGRAVYYEMTVWPLFDVNKQMIGRIYIAHDITALKELEHELRDLNLDLEDRVRARTHELAEAYDTTLEGWAKALELRDKETEGHSRRVTETTVHVARAMGRNEEEVEHIRRGAILHDIGKMGIPDHILRKKGALTDDERQIVMKHPRTAYDLLKQIHFLENALDIPYCHHEKWDGSGYPRGLKKDEIPLAARIFAVVDVWDALTYDRPYREAWKREDVIQYLIAESGTHFDPRVVNVFLGLVEKGEI